MSLLRFLRTELARRQRHLDTTALYAAEVRPDQWALAEARLSATGQRLAAYLSDDDGTHLELAIRRTGAGEPVTAIQDRGISLFAAGSEEELAEGVGRYLAAHGFLRFAAEIEIHAAPAERAERLEPEAIWTHGDDLTVATNESEEARA